MHKCFSHFCIFNQRILQRIQSWEILRDEKWHNQFNFLLKSKQCKPKIFLKVTVAYWHIDRDPFKSILSLCEMSFSVFSYSFYNCLCHTARKQDDNCFLFIIHFPKSSFPLSLSVVFQHKIDFFVVMLIMLLESKRRIYISIWTWTIMYSYILYY